MARPSGVKIGDPCSKCGAILTRENIVITNAFNIKQECRDCKNLYSKKWRENNPEAHIGYDLKALYGMPLEEFRRREELQLGGCAICKMPCKTGQRLSVDHDHKTNVVRDLLCKRCNLILGLANDDELLLFDILDYLKRHELKKAV